MYFKKETGPTVEIRETTHKEYYRTLRGLVKNGQSFRNDPSKYVGQDKYGNSWNIETTEQGVQNRVRYQNGVINEGGQNTSPRTWNNETGLNNTPVKRRKGKK